MSFIVFEELFEIPLRNGLTKPKRIRGEGYKMVNMGELFAYPRINNLVMDRAPLNEKEKESSLLKTGDLLFARQSLVREGAGQCSIFLNDQEEVCFESHLIRCRLKQDIANPTFYFYFFSSCLGKKIINTIVEQGAGAAGIRGSDLAKLIVPKPSIVIQERIAKILSDLDDKIYLNNQINQTLESIAQAIFKSWFIDFEPVRAKIAAKQEGKDPERAAMCAISGKSEAELEQMAADDFAELQATAALFPDELVESELGEVPRGWEVTNINAVTKSIFSGGTPSTKETAYWNGEIPWLSSGETRNKIIVSTEKSITELAVNKSSTKQAIYGDILIASAGQGHTRGQTSFNGMSCYINQSIVALRANDRISGYWLYYCLEPRYDEMRSLSDSHSSRGSLTTKLLASMPVILPTKELIFSFDKLVKQMFGQQLNNYKEIKTLADMRDALLPKLLSGEIILSKIMEEI